MPSEAAGEAERHEREVLLSGKASAVLQELSVRGQLRSWFLLRVPLRDPQGQPFVGGLAVEITRYAENERSLREKRQILDAVVHGAEEFAMTLLDPAGTVVSWNSGAAKILGYSAPEVVGKSASLFYLPEESGRVKAELEAAARSGRGRCEGWRVRKDGTRFWAEVATTALFDQAGQVSGFARVLFDATERREAQERALRIERAEEANRARSESLANMSHELRTPLNAIVGFAQLMADGKITNPDEQKEYLGDILSSARHLVDLINGVLDVAKIEAGKFLLNPEPVRIEDLVEEVTDALQTFAREEKISIRRRIFKGLGKVEVDRSRTKQVLFNYLSNALKFTPRGGRIEVRVKREPPASIRIEVEDSGPGIRPEDLPRLFRQYQQLDLSPSKKYPGTGLGLYLTKRIVELHGGSVGATSVPGKGSCLFAVFPREAWK